MVASENELQWEQDSLPEWSKGVDSSSTSASCVGSNPTAVSDESSLGWRLGSRWASEPFCGKPALEVANLLPSSLLPGPGGRTPTGSGRRIVASASILCAGSSFPAARGYNKRSGAVVSVLGS